MTDDYYDLPNAPSIPGLRFRHFRGESDYPYMEKAIAASADADKVERATTIEEIANSYAHLNNCDPYKDMIFAEIEGEGDILIEPGRHAHAYQELADVL